MSKKQQPKEAPAKSRAPRRARPAKKGPSLLMKPVIAQLKTEEKAILRQLSEAGKKRAALQYSLNAVHKYMDAIKKIKY